jgi:hypothetical protein
MQILHRYFLPGYTSATFLSVTEQRSNMRKCFVFNDNMVLGTDIRAQRLPSCTGDYK